ncbi:glycosyltransferase family 9 protein [Sulfurimonas sp.]
MKYPLHIILRKKLANTLNKFLSLFRKKTSTKSHLNPDDIKKIVLIRPNYRIGNILFLTPLINELNRHLPNAKIDVIVGMKLAGKILEPMPNVDKIIDIPRELLLHPLELFHYIKESREKDYDLAINISGGSTSAQIVMALIKAKYKASFADKKLWTHFTHIQDRGRKKFTHMGLESLEFLRFFNIALPEKAPSLDIKLTQQEIENAKKELSLLLSKSNIKRENAKVVALFRNARFDKKIEDSWWSELIIELQKIDANFVFVDILSPDIPNKLNDNVLEYANKDLRKLGAFFTVCDLFVSADTGPLHLAVASGAKIAALFTKTEVHVYGALGEKNKNIDINNLNAKDVAKLIA